MDTFNLKEYLKNNPLLKEEMEVDRFDYDDPNSPLAQLNDDDNAVNMLNNLISKYGKDVVQYWVTSGEYYDEDYLQETQPLKENDDYKIKLLVKTVYYDGDSGELYSDKNTYYTDAELKGGADQTSYTSGGDLDDMIFSNDYDTAKEFEEDYPGLFKVV